MHGDAEQEVVSHPFPPALPLVCAASVCPSIHVSVQIVQIVLKRFSFRPRISHSLGFDPVTDVPPARASRCSSACQQLEKGAVTKLVPPLLAAASVYHALHSSCAERDSNFKLRRPTEAVLSDGRD